MNTALFVSSALVLLKIGGLQEAVKNFLSPEQYMPHGQCYLWQTPLVGLHVASDLLIALAYFSIPLLLLFFVYKRKDVPFQRVFLLFGAFIVLCGTGHLLEVWTLWHPAYWLSGVEKAVTALVSCYTATELGTLLPRFLSFKTPEQLEAVKRELQAEIRTRQQAQEQLHQVNQELERRVQERTVEITHAAKREQATAHIVQRMRQTLDLNSIFSGTAQELRKAIECDRVVIYEFNADWSGQLIIESFTAGLPSIVCKSHVTSELNGTVVDTADCRIRTLEDTYLQTHQGGIYNQKNSYRVINDIYEADYEPCYLALLENLQVTAYIATPIFWNDTLWGLLFTYQHDAPREWSEADIKITTQIGTQLGLALTQVKLFEQTQRQTRELQQNNLTLQSEVVERSMAQEAVRFLQQITQKISEAEDLESALDISIELICETLGWDYGESWIPDETGDYLECVSTWHREDIALKELSNNSRAMKFARNAGLPGRVWQTREPEWLEDISNQPERVFARRELTEAAGLTTGVGIPIIDQDQVVALLIFFMSHPKRHQEQQVNLVTTAALQIGSLFQRKKAEGALRSSLATNIALLKALPDWKLRFRSDGTVINSRAPKNMLLPLESANHLGKHLTELLPLEVSQQFMAAIAQVQETSEVEVVEYNLATGTRERTFEARFSLGEDAEVITIIRDITERKEAEAKLQDALAREKELGELKTQFITMASHEFRTPLATILSSAELLEHYRHKWTEAKTHSHLVRIQSSTQHMTNLLNDVLLIGTVEAGKVEFNPVETNLVSFCRELVDELQVSTQTHRIHFAAGERELLVNADQKLLRQIFYNLLSNAVKYSPGKPDVYFRIEGEPNEAVIEVRDEGIGIPPEDAMKVFNTFDRASNVGNISGTGLGLPIVKKSIEIHEGSIHLESEVKKGAKFTVRFPLATK